MVPADYKPLSLILRINDTPPDTQADHYTPELILQIGGVSDFLFKQWLLRRPDAPVPEHFVSYLHIFVPLRPDRSGWAARVVWPQSDGMSAEGFLDGDDFPEVSAFLGSLNQADFEDAHKKGEYVLEIQSRITDTSAHRRMGLARLEQNSISI
jgi:hypothetical protein